MTTKSKGNSVRQRLVTLADKLAAPYRNVETAFLIERLVVRLVADKNLSRHLVFKGGFVGLRVYNSHRYTVDLDALLVKANLESTLALAKEKAEVDLDDGVWFRFEDQINLATQGEYGGIRQVYRAGIGEVMTSLKKAQVVHFDMGIGDPVTPAPLQTETSSLFSQNEDISWSIYPIETIVAEKLHALISYGDLNSRSKDVHDLSVFLPKVDPAVLGEAIKNSFVHRGTELPTSFSEVFKNTDTSSLARGWASAMASVRNAPEFGDAFAEVVRLMAKLEKTFE